MSKLIIAVDPGSSSGAIAWAVDDGAWVGESGAECRTVTYHHPVDMPGTPEEIFKLLQGLDHERYDSVKAVIENVGGTMPGNAAKSARTFATHMGHLEMACVALGIPCEKVLPKKWMKDLFGTDYPSNPRRSEFVAKDEMTADKEFKSAVAKAKTARKGYIHEQMSSRILTYKFTQRQADAVAILYWALMKEGGAPDA